MSSVAEPHTFLIQLHAYRIVQAYNNALNTLTNRIPVFSSTPGRRSTRLLYSLSTALLAVAAMLFFGST